MALTVDQVVDVDRSATTNVGSTISFKDKTTYPSSGVQGNSTLRRAKLKTENKTTAQSKFSCNSNSSNQRKHEQELVEVKTLKFHKTTGWHENYMTY